MRLNLGKDPGRWQVAVMNGLLLSILMILSCPLWAQQESVRSELSASIITLDESVTLSVVAIGVEGELDTSALNEKFEVLGRSSSRQISSIIGSNNQPTTSSVNTWSLELMPREAGVFTVPAVSVGGVSSQLLSLTVNAIPEGAKRDVFVEATVDTRTPWVQSQVLMTIRVFQGIEIVDGGLSDPVGTDIQVQRIGKDVYSNELRDGRQYSVTERRFALFPQKSGSLVVDPVNLSVSVPTERTQPRGLFSSTRKLTRNSNSLTLNVQARPPSGVAWWLPASAVTLESSWAGDGKVDARVDQPLTRTMVMRGIGVLDSQLPDIHIPAIDGVSLYAEEPVRVMSFDKRGLVADQSIKWALIPQREGELVLPAVSVDWFNTDTGRMETALLPEETISVGPSVSAGGAADSDVLRKDDPLAADTSSNENEALSSVEQSAEALDSKVAVLTDDNSPIGQNQGVSPTGMAAITTAPDVPADSEEALLATGADALIARIASLQSSINTWRVMALVLLTLWMISMFFYWWRIRQRRGPADVVMTGTVTGEQSGLVAIRKRANAAYRTIAPLSAVEAACEGADPGAVRGALLDWAAGQWPEHSAHTLTALASMLDEGLARELIQALDATLYSRTQNASANTELMSRLRSLPKAISESSASGVQTASAEIGSYMTKSSGKRGHGLPDL